MARRKIGIVARDHWVRITSILFNGQLFFPMNKVYVSKKSRVKIISDKAITKTYGKNLHGIMYARLLVSDERAIVVEKLIPVQLMVDSCQ
jgi:hypothetical protein